MRSGVAQGAMLSDHRLPNDWDLSALRLRDAWDSGKHPLFDGWDKDQGIAVIECGVQP